MKSHLMNTSMTYKHIRGFTLIELMIVVVIVAILASIALPAYNDQMRKGRRSDGVAAILQVAQAQERFFSRNFAYSSDINTELGFGADPYVSPEGYYQVAVAIPAGCATGNTCYTITATAVGVQAGDTTCATMSIDDRGKKTSTTTGECW